MTLAYADHLLPPNATHAEKALSAALNRDAVLGPGMDAIAAWRFQRPLPAGFGPWLVDEYQLGAVRRFFASDEACIDAGWPWQRLRGTLTAVDRAMGWIGYEAATVEPPQVRRRNWHRWQMAMGGLPVDGRGVPTEDPVLYDAEFLAGLSDPARSTFVRGHHGYDVRPVTTSRSRLGRGLLSASSGAVLPDGAAKWSHGRTHGPFEMTATAATLAALGLDTLAAGTLDWTSTLTWDQVGHLTWSNPTPEQVADLIANVLATLSMHVGFFDAAGDLIGARRVGYTEPATSFAGQPVPADQTVLTAHARTNFGDGFSLRADGTTAQPQPAASVALILGAHSTIGPGDLWVEPENLTAPDGVPLAHLTIGPAPLALTFGRTIRERIIIKARLL